MTRLELITPYVHEGRRRGDGARHVGGGHAILARAGLRAAGSRGSGAAHGRAFGDGAGAHPRRLQGEVRRQSGLRQGAPSSRTRKQSCFPARTLTTAGRRSASVCPPLPRPTRSSPSRRPRLRTGATSAIPSPSPRPKWAPKAQIVGQIWTDDKQTDLWMVPDRLQLQLRSATTRTSCSALRRPIPGPRFSTTNSRASAASTSIR